MQLHTYNELLQSDIVRLELELTSVCNLRCPLCIREVIDLPRTPVLRSYEEITNQLDSFSSLKYVTIAGAVSEPTTHPDLFKLLIYLKRREIEVSLYINGDTHTDDYYKRLGAMFHGSGSRVYFTICGSTQELHSRYRVNSQLDRVLRRLDIVNRFSGDRGVLTWIVFNYNEQDFNANYSEYQQRYDTEYFYTLPFDEHFVRNSTIRLPDRLRDAYNQVDRTDFSNIVCPANDRKFVQITHSGQVVPCSLYRMFGTSHCFECSSKNMELLRRNKIFNIAEPESEDSELPMRLHTNDN